MLLRVMNALEQFIMNGSSGRCRDDENGVVEGGGCDVDVERGRCGALRNLWKGVRTGIGATLKKWTLGQKLDSANLA